MVAIVVIEGWRIDAKKPVSIFVMIYLAPGEASSCLRNTGRAVDAKRNVSLQILNASAVYF